jgi:hypothetical protein
MNTKSYKSLCAATADAVRITDSAKNVWKDTVAPLALAYYATREAFEEQKAQFIHDAMLPGLTDNERAAFNVVLPKKNSDEFARECSRNSGYVEYHAALQKARTAVQKKCSGYANRIADYAWPVEDDGDDTAAKDPVAQFVKKLGELVTRGQKLEGAPFDLGSVMNHLLAAQKIAQG